MSYGLLERVRDEVEQRLVAPVDRVVGRPERRLVEVVERQEADQLADGLERLGLGVVHEVRHAGHPAVGIGAAQLVEAHFLVRHRLHHVRAGDEHVAHARAP